MEANDIKDQHHLIQNSKADHPVIKDCIKQLSPNRWLLGPSLNCVQDILSNTFSKFFKSKKSTLEYLPLDPKGPIQLVKYTQDQAILRIGDWAYFKSAAWNHKIEIEIDPIQFLQKKT